MAAKILICEDDGIIAIHIKTSLVAQGYAIAGVVASGKQAIARALETHPDLALMDIHLEGEMDGIEAAEQLRAQLDIPILYLTAYADEITLQRAKITGPHGYLLKPFDDRDLHVAIEIALNRYEIEKKLITRERHLTTLNEITQAALSAQTLEDLLQILANDLIRLIRADHCFITLWDESHQETLPAAASAGLEESYRHLNIYPDEATLTAEALRQGRSLIVTDALNSALVSQRIASQFPSHSLLVLPLITDNRKLGAVLLGFGGPKEFSQDEIAICQQAADLAALALAKALGLQETRQRAEELTALVNLSTIMRAAKTRSEIPGIVLSRLMEILRIEAAALVTCDLDGGELAVELGVGRWAEATGLPLEDAQEITRMVIHAGKPCVGGQPSLWPRTFAPDKSGEMAHALCIPLSVRDHKLGAIWIASVAPIGDNQQGLLVAIGDIVANAMHRQALYQDLQEQLSTLQKTKDLLVQTEKLAAVGKLVAGVAHELNNPIMTILLYAELLEQRQSFSEVRADLKKIVSESRRTAAIVRGLLDFSRQRKPERKVVQINDVLKSCLDLLAYDLTSHNVDWSVRLDPSLPVILADPYQVQQVFINLITNARQAMSAFNQAGTLTVVTELSAVSYPAAKGEGQAVIRISFRDTGPGILPENIPHIFDPFYTTKADGTGLGLSICHGIISEHGGYIWVESQVGLGTTIWVELPLNGNETPSPAPSPQVPAPTQLPKPRRVLIVDDEQGIVEVLGKALQRRGYVVDIALLGEQGLAYLAQLSYDLILCDLCMPGMSGQEFYRRALAYDFKLAERIIFTSGDVLNGESSRFVEETGAHFLPKPFELSDLFMSIKTVLGEG